MAVAWCVHHYQRFLVGIFTVLFCFNGSHSVVERSLTCGGTIDLSIQTNSKIYSGILKVALPKSFARYQGASTRQEYCDIQILFGSGVHLQIELYYLDIVPISSDIKKCSTALEVTDSANTQVYGGRLCEEGWRWEKQHREKKQEKRVVQSSPLRFRLVSDGPYKGTGFKVHYNVFRPVWPCSNVREFKCERLQRCVNEELTCDGWDDCGDDTDEDEEAGCDLLTVSEIFAVIIGIFLFIGTVAAIVVFMIKYRRIIKRNRLMRMESKLALDDERRSMQEPVLSFPHRFNSMESMNKSQYSRTTGQKLDIDSLMDRMELDKAEKLSYRDNMSERSHKSHRNKSYDNNSDRNGPTSRKNRAASQSSLTKEKLGSRPDLDKDAPEKDGRDEDKGSERRRSKERRRYSDDDVDYDSDRERRRRRRSRDRRRYDRSDDEDYDSDRERRRRSRDRYDSDEENDSDRERRRRRRSRDRRRYDSDEDYDSDIDRRRRRRSRDRQRDDQNSDEENGSDKESRRKRSRDRRRYSDDENDSDRDRRKRSRDRKRYDSDEYDSDRDRRRRRSRDRRSRDLSETKDEKGQSQPQQGSQEMSVKPPIEKPPYPPVGDNNRHSPYHEKERPRKAEELPVQKQRAPDLRDAPPKYEESPLQKQRAPDSHREPNNYPRPSTPPKSEQLQQRYNRAPQSNNVPPKDTNGSAWVPRSERKRNRRSRGEPTDAVYEDVVPKVVLENLGFREEAV